MVFVPTCTAMLAQRRRLQMTRVIYGEAQMERRRPSCHVIVAVLSS
jgi:hypothetical protein